MIDGRDLRIGNWILFNKTEILAPSDPQPVTGVTRYGVFTIYRSSLAFEKIFPIPLTPEVLLACGFEFDYESESWINELGIRLWSSEKDGSKNFYHINSELLVNLDYIHQLQNFYYCCTGEELIYSPTIVL
jgi:hypothetical protein